MNDVVLNLRLQKYSLNLIRKPGKIVRTRDKDILYATVPQTVQDRNSGFGALIFAYPHTKNILFTIQFDPYGKVHRFLHDLTLAVDMVVDCIQKYYRVDALQRALLPFFCYGQI